MKNLLQNLLIFFSLCLCGWIAFQWHREAGLRQNIQVLTDEIQAHKENLQGLQQTLKRSDEEIKRLDTLKIELTAMVNSNRTEIARLAKDLNQRDEDVEKGLKQVEAYKTALTQANEAIKKQNDDIRKQNDDVKKLSEERNEFVGKYNQVVKEFNDLAQKWNEAQAAAATNAPPPARK